MASGEPAGRGRRQTKTIADRLLSRAVEKQILVRYSAIDQPTPRKTFAQRRFT